MSILKAFILGLIQALTEFLPVSSSGHLELAQWLMDVQGENLTFSIVAHFGTALSTVVVFRKDLVLLARDSLRFQPNANTRFVLLVGLSMIPAGVVGLTLKDDIENLYAGTDDVLYVGLALLYTAALLFISHLVPRYPGAITAKVALWMGLAQAVALIPGVSRSGSTLATALILKVDPHEAPRFSFIMVLPLIFGAVLKDLLDYLEAPEDHTLLGPVPLLVGFLTSFLLGIVACKWMIVIVRRARLWMFGWYCLLLGLFAIGAVVLGYA